MGISFILYVPLGIKALLGQISLNTKIGREVPKVNLSVIHDLNNGKILQIKFFISSIVPEGYLVSWYEWSVFFLQLILIAVTRVSSTPYLRKPPGKKIFIFKLHLICPTGRVGSIIIIIT
jgi:hypothetical protein